MKKYTLKHAIIFGSYYYGVHMFLDVTINFKKDSDKAAQNAHRFGIFKI